jgi:hypothetical protein
MGGSVCLGREDFGKGDESSRVGTGKTLGEGLQED